MVYKNLVTTFVRQWNFARSETLELFDALTDTQLQFNPSTSLICHSCEGRNPSTDSTKWQPLSYQFACIGRTQLVYTEAITSGTMDFSLFHSELLPKKSEFQMKEALQEFLKNSDEKWIEAIRARRREENFVVKWPGFNQPLIAHITSLVSHERLHHGQLISYFTMVGIALPKNFKTNWAL